MFFYKQDVIRTGVRKKSPPVSWGILHLIQTGMFSLNHNAWFLSGWREDMSTSLALNHLALSSEVGMRLFIWSYRFSNSASVCDWCLCFGGEFCIKLNEKTSFRVIVSFESVKLWANLLASLGNEYFFYLQMHPAKLHNNLILDFLVISLERFSNFVRHTRDKLRQIETQHVCTSTCFDILSLGPSKFWRRLCYTSAPLLSSTGESFIQKDNTFSPWWFRVSASTVDPKFPFCCRGVPYWEVWNS